MTNLLLKTLMASGAGSGKDATFWMPEQASTVAQSVDLTFDVINWICYFFFVLITVALVWFIVKYQRKGHAAVTDGPVHNTTIEVVWTVIPLLLVIVIFVAVSYTHLTLPTKA